MSEGPTLSLILIVHESYAECKRTMGFLQRQTAAAELEIIIVGPSREQMQVDETDFEPFHSAQIVEFGAVESTGGPFAAGILAANAPYAGYAEEHDFPEPDLFAFVCDRARSGEYAAIGWAMANFNPGLVSWAHLYGQFGAVVEPVESGVTPVLGGHHAAYRRDLVLEYGDLLPHLLANENALQRDLHARGFQLYLAGHSHASHVNVSKFWDYAKLDFMGQRSYATTRARTGKWSFGRRVFYACAMPLVPFIRLRRSLEAIRRTDRSRLLPQVGLVMFGAMVFGAVGEAVGYLFGTPQKTCAARLSYELHRKVHVLERDQQRMSYDRVV